MRAFGITAPAPEREQVAATLADNGFYRAAAVATVQAAGGPTVYAAMEFWRFSLRGPAGAELERTLTCLAHNFRRLHRQRMAAA